MSVAAIGASSGGNPPGGNPPPTDSIKGKTFWSHCVDYISSSAGMYDLSMFGKTAIDWLMKVPQLLSRQESLAQTRSVLHVTSTVTTLPYLVFTATKSVDKITKLVMLPNPAGLSSAETEARVQKAARKAFVSTCTAVSAVADTLGNFHEANWIDLGNAYPAVSGVFYATNIVSEGADFCRAAGKVQINQNECSLSASEEKKAKAEKQITLSYIQMVKNISSIAGAIIGSISLGVAIMIGGVSVLPIIGLALSTVWITATIGMHFYNKAVVEAPLLSGNIKI